MIDLYALDPSEELYDLERQQRCRVKEHRISDGGYGPGYCEIYLLYEGSSGMGPTIRREITENSDGRMELEGFVYAKDRMPIKARWGDIPLGVVFNNGEKGGEEREIKLAFPDYEALRDSVVRHLCQNLNKGSENMICPDTKTYTPKERIRAKEKAIEEALKVHTDMQQKRLRLIKEIKASLNWEKATETMQQKTVEAVNLI